MPSYSNYLLSRHQLLGQLFENIIEPELKQEIVFDTEMIKQNQISEFFEIQNDVVSADFATAVVCNLIKMEMRESKNEKVSSFIIIIRDET
jgi:hypothetical protein